MSNNKLLNAIGLSVKSKNFIYGEKMIESIAKNKNNVKLVIVTNDISSNSSKRIKNKCDIYKIDLININYSSLELEKITKVKNIKAIGIIDINLVKLIKANI